MRVAACQVPDVRDDLPRALGIIAEMAERAVREEADVVLFPECFLQGYFTDAPSARQLAIRLDGTSAEPLLALSRRFPLTFIVGLIEAGRTGCHNSAMVLRSGELLGRYRKQALLDGERDAFTAGSDMPTFDIAGRSVAINICYDLQFPALSRRAAEQGAEVLLCPCNNMLRRENAERWKGRHNEIRAERAREAGLWLVSADVTGEREGRISYGPTAAIDPQGTVTAELPLLTEGMLIVDI